MVTLNYFADMSGGGVGVTLSNADCYFMKLGNSTVNTLDTSTPLITVLAGGRVVIGDNGLPGQGDDTHFLQRFALRTHTGYDSVEAMKFSMEHQNPIVSGMVTGGNIYPDTSYSFLTISNPNVLLWALKPAEDGIDHGIIVRLWNLSDNPVDFSLALKNIFIQRAFQTSHIETPIRPATVQNGILSGSLTHQQIATYLISISAYPQINLPLVHKK